MTKSFSEIKVTVMHNGCTVMFSIQKKVNLSDSKCCLLSGLLSTWCEDLGHQLLVRHQKSGSSVADGKSDPRDMHPQLQKQMGPMGAW